MVKPIPLLRVGAFIPFINFLDGLGAPTPKLLQQFKLPVAALNEPDILIPRHQAFDFLEKVAYQEEIPDLGHLVGERTPLISLGPFGRLVCQSPTLYVAISQVIRLANLFNSAERYWLLERGEKAWLAQEYVHLGGIDPHHASHFSLMMMVELIQKVAGKAWYPAEISLQTQKTRGLASDILSQATINTERGMTAIAFPRAFLRLSLPTSVNFVPQQRQQDYTILQASAPSPAFSRSLGQALTPQLPEGYPSIHLAAEIAQMSVRTMQRRLQEEDLTYSQLISHLRYELAIRLLQGSDLKIIDIAAELGYKDPAHFTRAFKRWTGMSPDAFRHQER